MSEILTHEVAHLLLATRQGLFGARVDDGETDVFPFALHGLHLRTLLVDRKGVPLVVGARDAGARATADGGRNWAECPGAAGLDIRALAGDGASVWAGLAPAGLLLSSDGGRNFAPVTGLAPALAQAQPAAPDTATAVTALHAGEGQLWVGVSGAGLWLSTDAGRSFRDVTAGLPKTVLALARVDTELWAGTTRGLFAAPATGTGTWREVFSTPERRAVTAIEARPQGGIAIGAARQIVPARPGDPKGADSWLYWSGDQGRTWSELANPRLPVMRGLVTGIVFDPRAPERFFAGTSVGEIFDCRDGGKSFRLGAGSLPGVNALAPGSALY